MGVSELLNGGGPMAIKGTAGQKFDHSHVTTQCRRATPLGVERSARVRVVQQLQQ
jgi:hypothetical protein